MIQYWTNLNDRERWTIGIGSALTLIYLIYLLIYSPMQAALTFKTNQLKENQLTLQWMKQVRHQSTGNTHQDVINNSKLLTLIATQLNDDFFRPFPHQIQQTTAGDVELTFDKVPYLSFLNWLWALEKDYSIHFKQFFIERTATPGVVKITLTLATNA